MKTKFKDFYVSSGFATNALSHWLDHSPYVKIVRWQAIPHGEYGCRIIIEYEEV